jgi:hypothetical protein
MSFGNNPADSAQGKWQTDRLKAQTDADRAARLSGHKSPLRRLLERLRPHRFLGAHQPPPAAPRRRP